MFGPQPGRVHELVEDPERAQLVEEIEALAEVVDEAPAARPGEDGSAGGEDVVAEGRDVFRERRPLARLGLEADRPCLAYLERLRTGVLERSEHRECGLDHLGADPFAGQDAEHARCLDAPAGTLDEDVVAGRAHEVGVLQARADGMRTYRAQAGDGHDHPRASSSATRAR